MNSLDLGCPVYLYSRQDFSYFYDYYAPLVYGHLLRQTPNTATADSILADVFFTLWQERATFNENQSGANRQFPLIWLLNIAYQKDCDTIILSDNAVD